MTEKLSAERYGVSCLTPEQLVAVSERYLRLAETRPTPIPESSGLSYSVMWPKAPLTARLIPCGFMGNNFDLDGDELAYEKVLEKFLVRIGVSSVFILDGRFLDVACEATYNEKSREWFQLSVCATETAVLAKEHDLVMISHEQWNYTVIGGSKEQIRTLENIFGGYSILKRLSTIDGHYGFGEEGRIFAQRYIIPWTYGDDL